MQHKCCQMTLGPLTRRRPPSVLPRTLTGRGTEFTGSCRKCTALQRSRSLAYVSMAVTWPDPIGSGEGKAKQAAERVCGQLRSWP